MAAVVVLYVLYMLRHAWLLIYVAAVLAIMFDPAVKWVTSLHVHRWHPGRGLSVAAVGLVLLAFVTAIVFFIVPRIAADASRLERQWPMIASQATDWIHSRLPFSRSITADSLISRARQWTGGSPLETVGSSVADAASIALLVVYLLVDARRIMEWTLSLVAARHRPATRRALVKGAHRMQHWVGGQAVLMLVHGASALLVFWLIGLPYFFPIAIFAGVINVIPFLGPILTLVVAGAVAAVAAPGKLLAVVVFYLVYHNVEGLVLQPRIMSHAVGVPGVTIIIALLIGYEVAGVVGMLVAVPTAVLIAELKHDLMPSRVEAHSGG